MTLPPADALPAPLPVQRPSRALTIGSALCASITLAAAALFGPIMWFIGSSLRPQEFQQSPPPDEVHRLQQAVIMQVWEIVIGSFLALCILAALTVFLGRRSLRRSGNATSPAGMTRWATRLLIGSVIGGVLEFLSARYPLPLSSLNTFISIPLLLLIPACLMAAFLLSAIVVGQRFPGYPPPEGRGLRIAAGIDFAVSLVLLLAWGFVVGAGSAFIAGFYLHLVW